MLLFSWCLIPSSKTGASPVTSARRCSPRVRGVRRQAGGVLCWRGRAGLAWRGQGGGEPGEQDVEAAFELGGAVVGGQDGGQAAEQGEVGDRGPGQAQPAQGVGFV